MRIASHYRILARAAAQRRARRVAHVGRWPHYGSGEGSKRMRPHPPITRHRVSYLTTFAWTFTWFVKLLSASICIRYDVVLLAGL